MGTCSPAFLVRLTVSPVLKPQGKTPKFSPMKSEMTDDLDVDAMLEAPFKKEVSGIFFNCIFFFLFIITFQGNFWFLIYNFVYNYYCYLLSFIIFPVLVMKY